MRSEFLGCHFAVHSSIVDFIFKIFGAACQRSTYSQMCGLNPNFVTSSEMSFISPDLNVNVVFPSADLNVNVVFPSADLNVNVVFPGVVRLSTLCFPVQI